MEFFRRADSRIYVLKIGGKVNTLIAGCPWQTLLMDHSTLIGMAIGLYNVGTTK